MCVCAHSRVVCMAAVNSLGASFGWQAKLAGTVASCFIEGPSQGLLGAFCGWENNQGVPGEGSDSPYCPSIAIIERGD